MVHGSEAEEDFVSASDEEEKAGVEIVPEDSFVDGRRQYATRRRVHLRQTRATGEPRSLQSRKVKRSRIVRVEDSSEEEEVMDETKRRLLDGRKTPVFNGAPGTGFNTSPLFHGSKSDPKQAAGEKSSEDAVQQKQGRDRQGFSNQAEELDFQEPLSTSCVKTQVRFLEGFRVFKMFYDQNM